MLAWGSSATEKGDGREGTEVASEPICGRIAAPKT